MTGAAQANVGARTDPLAGYAPPVGVADEVLRPDRSIRPVWEPLIRHLAARPAAALAQDFARGDQYLRDAGVFFRVQTTGGSDEREWPFSHVPVMVSGREWEGVAAGLTQRAELLERVMADLYGAATLVRDGLLPPELVARNPEWLRPIVGIRPRSGHFLHFLAFEIGRSPDGSWMVLGDRTQAPSGAGFALENRVASSRVFADLFPQANVERLAGFFRAFRDALSGLGRDRGGRVAILTPGQHTDTYFEHAYIARYLAIALLEGEDLKVENGALTVRTISGPEPVSVLWRRLDSRFADPLELDEGSALGTPGMVQALRSGAIDMMNCLGSGVLESRALMAFLPRICEAVMGVPLALPNIATWWCGQRAERDFVAATLDRMLIGPALSTRLPFDQGTDAVHGGPDRAAILRRLDAAGETLVGQEAITLSTTPAMIDGRLAPRPMILRVFAARTPDGWTVMPGGYARIGRTGDPMALSMQAGGSVADVWVVPDAPVVADTLATQTTGPSAHRNAGRLPSRAADNLYWLGRYLERAETGVRLLRAYHGRLDAAGRPGLPLAADLAGFLRGVGLDPDQPLPDGLLSLFDVTRACAAKIRDRFSQDGWNALNDLSGSAHKLARKVAAGDDAARAMGVLLRKIAGFSGLLHDNMFHSNGWRFLTMGRALERADQTASVLAVFADLALPQGGFDIAVEVGDSVMTHRRRYAVETSRNTVVDLLALDAENPRAILYQLDQLLTEHGRIADSTGKADGNEASRRILLLHTALTVATPEELDTQRLVAMRSELAAISDALTGLYLS